MFQLCTTVKEANAYSEAGLLWWVGRGDGGPVYIVTCPYGMREFQPEHLGAAGVLLEE